MPTITVEMLRQKSACSEQVGLFLTTFGASAPLTPETWQRAQEAGLEVFWCECLLPAPLREAHDAQIASLRKAYSAQVAPLWEAHDAQVAPLRKAYSAQVAPLWKAYDAQVAPLRKAYSAQVAPLWKAYDAQVAPLRKAYDAQIASLREAYDAQVASLLFDALMQTTEANHGA